jgi:putative ABC transport system permease protein
MVVGSVVVAQTLYASTKEHLYEFATLRAIGSSGTYLHTVIIAQALLSAVAGFAIAFLIGLFVVRVTSDSALPVLMTPGADRYFVPAHYRDVRHFRAVLDP